MSAAIPGLIKLDLEVGGVPVCLGAEMDSREWCEACKNGVFSGVGFLGKLLLGAGISAGQAYTAKNQALNLFGGKVFIAPGLENGPMTFGTSAMALFRGGSLYRLTAGVTGNTGAASSFERRCTRALVSMLGDPRQRAEDGAPVWLGRRDRLTLLRTRDAYLVHELITG